MRSIQPSASNPDPNPNPSPSPSLNPNPTLTLALNLSLSLTRYTGLVIDFESREVARKEDTLEAKLQAR